MCISPLVRLAANGSKGQAVTAHSRVQFLQQPIGAPLIYLRFGFLLHGNITSINSGVAESSAKGGGPVTSHFRKIPVVDGNGDQLTLYEFRERALLFGLFAITRLELCTGELVQRAGRGYVISSTGEKLKRVKAAS
jgi:hypothetical protein